MLNENTATGTAVNNSNIPKNTKRAGCTLESSITRAAESDILPRHFVHDSHHVGAFVQDVEVDARGAFFEELGGLGDALFDADLFAFGGIVAGGFEVALQAFGQTGAADGGDAHHLLRGKDGQ